MERPTAWTVRDESSAAGLRRTNQAVPIFDHRCKSCGYTWEGFVNRSAPNPPCPKCKSETEHVLLTPLHREREFRMRSAAKIKKRVTGDIRKLNGRLLVASNKLAIEIQKHEIAETPPGVIVVALFRKAVNTFRGIQLLKSDRLLEESFVLLRVLLESHINLVFFLDGNAAELTKRWLDAAMLEKLKYLKEVKFFEGTGLEEAWRRESWEKVETEIVARYTKAEVHAMRKNGFSGLSVQARAEAIGLGSLYSHCYRITSRSVHTFDPAETGMMDYMGDEAAREDLLSSRREMLDSTQNLLLGRLAYLVSEIVKDPLISVRMLALGLGYEKYKDKKDGESAEADVDPGKFYIWRE